jgi:RIP metalloprotease RseP
MIISIIIFFLILGLLVLIHEFGHFVAAKKQGILVEEFGFGFPPRIWGIKKGETLYSINAIPLGGFVRVYTEKNIMKRTKKMSIPNCETELSFIKNLGKKLSLLSLVLS